MSVHTRPTKRELRERRRAERLEAERAEAASGTRRKRLWTLLGIVGVAAVAVAAAAVISSSGSKPEAPAASVAKITLFDGIQEKGGVLGDPKAPVTLTEYVDLQCPVCAAASREMLPTVVRDYVRTGKAKLDARMLHFIGPDSDVAARFAAGAEKQGRLWPFLEAFYAAQGQENSGYVTDDFLRSVSAAAGVDYGAAKDFADTAAAQERLDRADVDANRLKINSTPTLTVARDGGPAHVIGSGVQKAATVGKAIAMAHSG